MGIYHVQLPVGAKSYLKEGKDGGIVVANSTAEAKEVMKAYLGLPSDAAWAAATVTAITEGVDLDGWRCRCTVQTSAGVVVEQVTVTAVATDDFDDIGGDLATALNATASIAGAAYATPNLKVAETTDTLGDHKVVMEMLPPITGWDDKDFNFQSLFGTITDEGAAGAALNVVLNNIKTPQVVYQVGSGH
jgi:hypothetical protein